MHLILIRLHTKLCRELGIPRAKIKILKRCRRKNNPGYGALYMVRSQTIYIYVDDCRDNNHDPRRAMAHETLHHFQNCMGWFGPNIRSWKGRPQSDYTALEYVDRPWEAQAELYEETIAIREGWT